MSYKKIGKLEKEVIDGITDLEDITDPEDLARLIQELLKKVTKLQKMYPSAHHGYEAWKDMIKSFSKAHFNNIINNF